jgi:hypothetical protein
MTSMGSVRPLIRLVTLAPLTVRGATAATVPANRPLVNAVAGSPTGAEGLKSARTPKPPEALRTSASVPALIRLPITVISTRVNTTSPYMMRMAPVRNRRAIG